MVDVEKVIIAWEIFRDSNPYQICDGKEFRAIKEPEYCMGQMIEDTITLLKGQEAIVPVYTTNSHPFHIGVLYRCGNCHHSLIRDEDLFCRHCGKPIDWTKKAVKLE